MVCCFLHHHSFFINSTTHFSFCLAITLYDFIGDSPLDIDAWSEIGAALQSSKSLSDKAIQELSLLRLAYDVFVLLDGKLTILNRYI
jgi:hypothetical protein